MDTKDKGRRIMLVSCFDPWATIKPGDKGSVDFIDDAGTIHVKWDNGSMLGLIPGEDKFSFLT